jgi:hypothetical protein
MASRMRGATPRPGKTYVDPNVDPNSTKNGYCGSIVSTDYPIKQGIRKVFKTYQAGIEGLEIRCRETGWGFESPALRFTWCGSWNHMP